MNVGLRKCPNYMCGAYKELLDHVWFSVHQVIPIGKVLENTSTKF